MAGKAVFISYSHDSDEHREKVLALAERLREDGLDARLDQYVNGTPKQGWPRWMLDQLDEADFVLTVCTETYYRRFRGHEEPGRGKGVDWEGALITQEIYDSRSRTVKFVPVMIAAGQERFIPEPLRGHTHYELTSEERYEALYVFLRGKAGVKPRPLGKGRPVSKRVARPLTFDPSPATATTEAAAVLADEPGDLRDRQILLERVRSFWIEGLLGRVEEEMPLQPIPKELDPGAVIRPWQTLLEASVPLRSPLPAQRTAFEVFEDSGRALLILGAPGSGKTIALLELAREAAARAERNPGEPVPVVFNLSTWAERQAPLIAWLTDELALKYQIPRRIGRRWLETDGLLLLLDGLDEVPEARRVACVAAINRFREEQGLTGLAVACRLGDYETLGKKLLLSASMILGSLESEQVEAALTHGGPGLASLQKVLLEDDGLRELARSPLLLAVMRRAYQDLPAEELLDPRWSEPAARRQHLFNRYVDRMLLRRGGELPYPRERFLGWLAQLACGMKQRNQSIFLLEEIQPGWLERRRDLILYTLVATIVPWLPLVAGLIFIGAHGLGAVIVLCLLIVGMVDGVAQAVLRSREMTSWHLRILRASLIFLGVTVVCFSTLPATSSLRTKLFYSLIAGFWSAASGLASRAWNAESRIRPFESVTWSWRHVIRNLTSVFSPAWLVFMMFLGNIVLAMFVVESLTLVDELGAEGSPIVEVLENWPAVALLIVFALSGFSGAAKKSRSYPNQGIWLSGKHGLVFGFAGAVVSFIPILFMILESEAYAVGGDVLEQVSRTALRASLSVLASWHYGLAYAVFSCSIGCCLGLLNGGLDFMRHFLLRPFLSLGGRFPLNIVRFLDFSADRILLYKVGGGYVFIHRLLLEHFAALGEEGPGSREV
ncbi:MAG TPA: SEFIR domain-containing protein [Thermoanaerobaculia bacterium]|nr:SEFIR domain-containing protein [Thermoanaerobaculia bacterium]